jgi:hypothetical protein
MDQGWLTRAPCPQKYFLASKFVKKKFIFKIVFTLLIMAPLKKKSM